MFFDELLNHSAISLAAIAAVIVSVGTIWQKAVKPAFRSIRGWIHGLSQAAETIQYHLAADSNGGSIRHKNEMMFKALFPDGETSLGDIVREIRTQQQVGATQRSDDHRENATRLDEIEHSIEQIHGRVEHIEIRQDYSAKLLTMLPAAFPEEIQKKVAEVLAEHPRPQQRRTT